MHSWNFVSFAHHLATSPLPVWGNRHSTLCSYEFDYLSFPPPGVWPLLIKLLASLSDRHWAVVPHLLVEVLLCILFLFYTIVNKILIFYCMFLTTFCLYSGKQFGVLVSWLPYWISGLGFCSWISSLCCNCVYKLPYFSLFSSAVS